MIHTDKGFGIIKKEEVDVFLELSCFFNDPMDVGGIAILLLSLPTQESFQPFLFIGAFI